VGVYECVPLCMSAGFFVSVCERVRERVGCCVDVWV